jgi:hypothetical protein
MRQGEEVAAPAIAGSMDDMPRAKKTLLTPSNPAPGKYSRAPLVPRGPRAGTPKQSKPNPRTHLPGAHLRSILNAEAFADHLKVGFAVHVTMHWRSDPTFTPALWSKRLTRFLDKLTRWLQRREYPVAFAWVNEVGVEYGEHTHIALHLPHPRRLKGTLSFGHLMGELALFIRKTEHLIDGTDKRGKAWPAVEVKGGSFGMRTARMRSGVIRYWAKSLSDHDMVNTGFGTESKASLLGIRTKPNASMIENKRCGVSTTIGPKVRQAAGWTELTSLEDFHARLHPT